MPREKKRSGQDKFSVRSIDALLEHGLKPEDIPAELKGKPVQIHQVNFETPLEKKVQARYGPPPYALRAKQIEQVVERLLVELRDEYLRLAEAYRGQGEKFGRVWKAIIATLELDELNHLIKEHNAYYPIEANLSPDPQTGGYLIGCTPWKPKPKITPDSLLGEFPPRLEAALERSPTKS